jgi:RimJ/RimL family protein N-acetyltransferase
MRLRYKNIELRLATPDDAEYLVKYWNESGWGITLDEARERLDIAKNKEQHMIELDGRIIGDIHYGEAENNSAEIGVYIREETAKGKGYGKIIMAIYIDALINHLGYENILINTSVDNKAMRRISENTFGLTPTIHENVYQEQSGTYESYVAYVLKKENWQNEINYETLN